MTLSYAVAVDLTPEFNRQLNPKFSVSLGDHGSREYTVTVMQDLEPFEIAEGCQVSIVGKKPDGTIFAYECTYADSYVYFTIEEQMTPVQGIVACELSIVDADGNKLGSANFTYWVEPSPVTDGDASESDLQLFQQAVDAAADLRDVKEILEVAVPIAEQIGDIDKLLSAFPTEEVSGSLIAFTDGADSIPAKKLTLNLQPHQAGTGDPSPDNVRAISGYTAVKVTRAGKNLLEYPYISATFTRNGLTFTDNGDGSVTIDGTSTAQTDFVFTASSSPDIEVPDSTCIVSLRAVSESGGEVPTSGYYIHLLTDASGVYINVLPNQEAAVATGGFINSAVLRVAANRTLDKIRCYPMIRSTSFADDAFESYTAQEYNITIPSEAGIVYGGTLDVTTGTLTVDRGFVTMTGGSSEEWAESASDYYCRFRSAIFDGKTPKINQSDIYSNRFIGSNTLGIHTGTAGLAVRKAQFPATVTSLEECITWLASNPVEAAYPLANPVTYSLTAEEVTTLLGNNTLWMDADGSIDLTYRADTGLYVEKRIAEVQALILENNG